jgi:hypothetical protein
MPILTNTSGSSGAEYRYDLDDAPTGTYPAVLCDMKHTSGAKVPSFDDPTVLEDKDLSVFLFSYEHEGEVHFAQTWEMTQSSSERSKLFKMLKSIRGEAPVFEEDYDYSSEIGRKVQITVGSKISKKGTKYTTVDSATPLLSELHDRCPKIEDLEIPGGRQTPIPDANGNPF